MADDKRSDNSPRGSHVDSLIDRLNLEVPIPSDDDIIDGRRLTIHPTTHRHELSTNSSHDIDREITELEGLIKKLQSEIVEMTKSANKPLPNFNANFLSEHDDDDDDDEENISKENNKEAKHIPVKKDEENEKKRSFKLSKGPHNPDVFPIIIKNDSVLEAQAKMFAENMANLIKISDPDIDTLDDVRRNFSMLWDDEDVIEDISSISDSPPKPLNDPSFKPSDNLKTHLINNVFIESFDTLNINTQEELRVNFPAELKDKIDEEKVHKTINDNTQTKLKDCTELNRNTSVVSDKRNRISTIIMQAKTSGNPLKDNTKKVHIENDSGTITVMDKPIDIKSQKEKLSIPKINDDKTQTKLNDPASTEYNKKASMASGNRNRNTTIIMQANTYDSPLRDNTSKVYIAKDTGTTSVSGTDTPTEIKTEQDPKIVITGIKNAMQNKVSSEDDEDTTISSNTPYLADKSSAKSESYSIIRTLRRIVGRDSIKSINKEEKKSQNQNSSTEVRKGSIIIKDNPKIDTKNVVTGMPQTALPKLGTEKNLGKEIQQASSSTYVDNSKEQSSTTVTNPKRNYEIVPMNFNPDEKQPPSAPSDNSNEFGNYINNSNLQTLVSMNTKATGAMPKELENKITPIQEPNTDADNNISSTHNTIPDAFNQNVVIEDAKTVLRNATSAAVKKSGAMENPVVMTDGLAEGDIHNKCESVGNDDDTLDDEDDDNDDEAEEGDSNNPYDVD